MAFSGGTFSLIAGNPVTTNTTISSSWANDTLNDIAANGLTMCVLKDGSQTITANIPMATFKFTGLGSGTAATDSATLAQAQSQHGSTLTSVAGTNTITGTATPTPAYTVGQKWTFVPANTNTGAATLNISSLGAGAVQLAGAALTGGELVASTAITVVTTATTPVFEIIGMTQFSDTRALVVGGTDSTKKLRFEVDGITTATTRVITMPDKDVTLADATTTAGGLIELLTQAEYDAGTDTSRAPTASLNRIALGTEVASTSGTTISFTGIPAGTRRITANLIGVSLSGATALSIRLGDAGGPESAGYAGTAAQLFAGTPAVVAFSSEFRTVSAASAAVYHGQLTFVLEDSSDFTWTVNGALARSDSEVIDLIVGSKATSAVLTQIQFLSNDGSSTFDAGVINISYER